MTIVSIHQPCFFPYLGVFYKILKSDRFVFLDDAQYTKSYCFEWNRIKTPNGECRFKIPISYRFGDGLNEVLLQNTSWKKKMLTQLYFNYKRSLFFDEVYSDVENMLEKDYFDLADINEASMLLVLKKLGYALNKIFYSSCIYTEGKKEAKVIDICKKLYADEYLSGKGAMNYQKEEHFLEKGIKLTYTDFEAKPYNQNFGEFRPNMSILDFLFNEGYNKEKIMEMHQ